MARAALDRLQPKGPGPTLATEERRNGGDSRLDALRRKARRNERSRPLPFPTRNGSRPAQERRRHADGRRDPPRRPHPYPGWRTPGHLHLAPGDRQPTRDRRIAHGAAEHAQRYDRFARYLCTHGFAVVPRPPAATARPPPPRAASASGASRATPGAPSSPTCAPSATTAPREFPGAPLYPLGHGMGSMLARDCAQEYGGDLSGLIHSGTFRSPPATDPDADHHSPRGRDPRGRPHRPVRLRPQLFASFNDPLDPAPATNGSRATRRGGRLRGGRAMRLRLQRGPVPRRGPRRPQDQRPPNQARTPTRLPVHIAVGTKDPCNQADGAGPRAHRGLSLPRPP